MRLLTLRCEPPRSNTTGSGDFCGTELEDSCLETEEPLLWPLLLFYWHFVYLTKILFVNRCLMSGAWETPLRKSRHSELTRLDPYCPILGLRSHRRDRRTFVAVHFRIPFYLGGFWNRENFIIFRLLTKSSLWRIFVDGGAFFCLCDEFRCTTLFEIAVHGRGFPIFPCPNFVNWEVDGSVFYFRSVIALESVLSGILFEDGTVLSGVFAFSAFDGSTESRTARRSLPAFFSPLNPRIRRRSMCRVWFGNFLSCKIFGLFWHICNSDNEVKFLGMVSIDKCFSGSQLFIWCTHERFHGNLWSIRSLRYNGILWYYSTKQ